MEWSYFVERLGGSAHAYVMPQILRHAWVRDERLEVQGVQLIRLPYIERRVYSRDFIFVGLASQLPPDPADAPYDCVCVADTPLPEGYSAGTVPGNMLVLEPVDRTLDLGLLQNHISFVLADDFRYFRGLERINRLRPGGSLRDAVLLAERLVTNPVILLDSRGRLLAAGGQYAFVNTWLRDAEQNGGLSPAQLHEIQSDSVYVVLRDAYFSHVESHAWVLNRFLCVPVRVRGLEVAQLVVESDYSAFHYSSVALMEPLSQLLAELIDRRMEDNNDRSLLHTLLFLELLRATPEENPELRRRIAELNWREKAGMRLLCCDGRTAEESAFEQLRKHYPAARWTVLEDQWLMLLYPGEEQPQPAQVLETLGLRAGLSWPFDRLARLPDALIEARTALTLGAGALTDYASVFAAHICMLPAQDALRHLHPGAALLIEYDRTHDGNLADTLEAYLSGPEQPNEAAARLFISRSTLFYRINRIRELCGVELTTGEERMNLLISLRLQRLLGER